MNPGLLLLEDDPVSRGFLSQALAPLGLPVDCAGGIAEAETLARERRHAVWLFDLCLPDGDGRDLLARLRREGRDTPALALTADDVAATDGMLRTMGFRAALSKPVSGEALRRTVSDCLALPAWDDRAALAALADNAEAMRHLRKLFLDELPEQLRQVLACLDAGDVTAARALLHRLKGSCGFVGAAALGQAARALHDEPWDSACRRTFEFRARELLRPGDGI
ncbi:response regulator [Arenimonas fontis]|nr:response regulator [Arenimonas fontis]